MESGRQLYFCSVVSSIYLMRYINLRFTYLLTYLFFFFSSYNLSRCRLDICHTSAHDVALVRRCRSETYCTRLAEKYRMQKVAKNRHLRTIAHICWAISSQLRHVLTIEKKACSTAILLHMSSQYGELRPTSG